VSCGAAELQQEEPALPLHLMLLFPQHSAHPYIKCCTLMYPDILWAWQGFPEGVL
jgi:hypothetical protein